MEKQKETVKTADEALELAKTRALTTAQILHRITGAAQAGMTFILFLELVEPKSKSELMDKGFLFGTATDPIGQKQTKISWLQ